VRLVLDTSVFVSALRSPNGASAAIVARVSNTDLALLLTPSLCLEYEAVAKRPEQLTAARLTPAEVDDVLDALTAVAIQVDQSFQWRPLSIDPADDMVLETAINGYADVIVSFNLRHLLAPAARFGVLVMSPADFMMRLT
jgi:putative PIN family toxin of toxin-antitoxin system